MKNFKVFKILLLIIIIITLSFGVLGFYISKTTNNTQNNNKSSYSIKLLYYLNSSEKLTDMPSNSDEETLYKFDKYVCTNNVKGTWDDENWKFNIQKTADATCKLYFVSATYNTTLNITNGTLDENAVTIVNSNADGVFKINATEGYTYDTATCSNNEEIVWDETTSELTVKSIKSDTACNVNFKLKEYNVEISVTNGKSGITKIIQYNKSFTSTVTPTSGYGNPTITCNNVDLGQSVTSGTWANNIYTMNSITSNIKCVIEFKLVEVVPVTYSITLEIVPSGTATVTSPLSVKSGESVTFAIDIEDGYKIGDLTECKGAVNNDNGTITISNVQKNSTCRIIMVEDEG